jgi:hypothetical protein
MTGLSQAAALSSLVEALNDTFNEALDLLPRMIEAYRAKQPLPRRNPSVINRVCAALSFVENDKPLFLTLAHLNDDGKVSYQTEEALVWIALEAATCATLEDNVCGVKRGRGFFGRFRGEVAPDSDSTISTASIHMLMRNTQSIGIRAAFLENFIRNAIEHIARTTAANTFEGSREFAQRHLENYQSQIEKIAPYFVDREAAVSLIKSISMPVTPIVIAQKLDDDCENLNGIPMTREHASAWRGYLGKLQGSAFT